MLQLFISLGWVTVNILVMFPKAQFSHLQNGRPMTMIMIRAKQSTVDCLPHIRHYAKCHHNSGKGPVVALFYRRGNWLPEV